MFTAIIIIISVALVLAFIWMARVLDAANQLPPPLPPQHPDNQAPARPFPAAQPVQRELVREFSSGKVYEVSFRKKDGTVRHYSRFLTVFVKTNGFIEGIVVNQEVELYFPDTKEAGVGVKQAGFMPSQILTANEVGQYTPSQMEMIAKNLKAINMAKSHGNNCDSLSMDLYDLIQLMERE